MVKEVSFQVVSHSTTFWLSNKEIATLQIVQDNGEMTTQSLREMIVNDGWIRYDFEKSVNKVRSWPYLELCRKGLMTVDVKGRSKFWSLTKMGEEVISRIDEGLQGETFSSFDDAREAADTTSLDEIPRKDFEYAVHLLSHLLLRAPDTETFMAKRNKLVYKFGMPESIMQLIDSKGISAREGKKSVSITQFRDPPSKPISNPMPWETQ